MKTLQTSDFAYDLPAAQVAQYPLERREETKLLAVDVEKGIWKHAQFANYLKALAPLRPLFILNNTLVLPVRFHAKDTQGRKVEVFLLNPLEEGASQALLKPLRKRFVGETLILPSGESFSILSLNPEVRLRFNSERSLSELMESCGVVPLPPYLNREAEALDRQRYQTVYAEIPGSLAAPTAGLHFSEALLDELKEAGAQFAFLTLHIGLGTFQPVRTEVPAHHEMHEEFFYVPEALQQQIEQARWEKRPILAVGTTSFRALESWWRTGNSSGRTNLFVYPEHEQSRYLSTLLDGMLTNFHQPESTLSMLVAALMRYTLWKQVYHDAIQNHYRFFSYGDANFIWFRTPEIFSSSFATSIESASGAASH